MNLLLFVFGLFFCSSAVSGFNCPKSEIGTSYHAPILRGCKVSYVCDNAFNMTLSCPREEPFNETDSSYARPIIEGIVGAAATFFDSNDTTIKDFLVPIIYDIMYDSQAWNQMQNIFRKAKEIYAPIASDLVIRRLFGSNTFNHLSQQRIGAARFQFYTETKPMFLEIFQKRLRMILTSSSEEIEELKQSNRTLRFYLMYALASASVLFVAAIIAVYVASGYQLSGKLNGAASSFRAPPRIFQQK